jgi:hypothetical protein
MPTSGWFKRLAYTFEYFSSSPEGAGIEISTEAARVRLTLTYHANWGRDG